MLSQTARATVVALAVLGCGLLPAQTAQAAPVAVAVPVVAPAAAAAPDVSVDEVPVDLTEPAAPAPEPARVVSDVIESDTFQTVGVTWAAGSAVGDVAPQVRTRDGDAWSSWVPLGTADESPDSGTVEDRRQVRDGTPSLWVGDADAVQVSLVVAPDAAPADLQVTLVASDPVPASAAPLSGGHASVPGAGTVQAAALPTAVSSQPAIISRAAWGARAPACAPDVASRLVGAVVHHTADGDYGTVADAMQALRNDQRYHIESRGWCDIGYNFVVDKWGNIYEGREGSLTKAVIGVHAGGFNTATVGISMLGNYTSQAPTGAQLDAVARVAAWRLGAYGVDPTGSVTYYTLGGENSKYPAGTTLTLPTIFAHRDVAFTACPGDIGYQYMNTIRSLARQYWDAYGASGLGANLVKSAASPSVYLATAHFKYRLTDVNVLAAFAPLGPVAVVDQGALDARTSGVELGRFIRDQSGEIDLVDSGTVHRAGDCAELAAWGASCADFPTMALPDPMVALLARGPELTTAFVTPTGRQFVVSGGTRYEIADAVALQASPVQPNGAAITLGENVADNLPLGAPIVRTGIVVQGRGSGAGVLLDRAAGLRMSAAYIATARIGQALPLRPLDDASVALLPAPRGDLTGVLRAPDGRRVALTMGGSVVLAADQVPGDPGVAVDAGLITALAPGGPVNPLFVRSVESTDLFVLAAGVKRPVPTMEVAYALAAGSPLVVALVPQAALDAVTSGPPLLAPATLVKVAGAPSVYVVDGLSRLVHLPSFEMARSVGLPTGYTEIPSASTTGYTVAAQPLGTIWRCGTQDAVALDGRMAPIPAGMVASGSAPATTMDPLTCAHTLSATSWTGPVFVRATGSTALFVLAGGVKRPVPTMAVAYAVAAGSRFVLEEVPAAGLAAVPTGATLLAPGSLVKVTGAAPVYVVDGLSGLVHLPSFDVARAVGISTAFTEVASVTGYTVAAQPLGTLWRSGGRDYVAVGGSMAPIPAGVVASSGAPATAVDPLTLGVVPRGGAWGGPVFVRSTGAPALYVLSGGTKRPVATMDRAYALAAGSGLVVALVSQASLDLVPAGPAA